MKVPKRLRPAKRIRYPEEKDRIESLGGENQEEKDYNLSKEGQLKWDQHLSSEDKDNRR